MGKKELILSIGLFFVILLGGIASLNNFIKSLNPLPFDVLTKPEPPPFKTAKIVYKVSEKKDWWHSESIETVYIDIENNRRRTEASNTSIYNEKNKKEIKTQMITIADSKKIYFINPGINAEAMDQISESWVAWTDHLLEDKAIIGEEEILGRKCKIYQLEGILKGVKVWAWQGITLKEERLSEETNRLKEAIEIEENISLNNIQFELPKDIPMKTFTEVTEEALRKHESSNSNPR